MLLGYWAMKPIVGEFAVSAAFALSSVITAAAMSIVVRNIRERRTKPSSASVE
jgi:hypothetical protein